MAQDGTIESQAGAPPDDRLAGDKQPGRQFDREQSRILQSDADADRQQQGRGRDTPKACAQSAEPN